jgi:hypothetical protein
MSETIEALRAAIKELEEVPDSEYDKDTRDSLKRLLETRIATLAALEANAPGKLPDRSE